MGKATVRRRITRKRKVNRKNKKTQCKGKKQSGGRRRPDGSVSSGNNGSMNEGGTDYLNEEKKEEAIAYIQDNKLDELLELLGTRTFPDDGALMAAVRMEEPNIRIISEVIFRTYIHGYTENNISAAMEKTPDLLIEVIDALKQQELRQEEAAALAQQEKKYANNGRVSTPLPRMNNDD